MTTEPGITRSPDGTFRIRVSHLVASTGKRYFKVRTYRKDEWRSRATLKARLQAELLADCESDVPGMTLRTYAQQWLDWGRSTGKQRIHVGNRYSDVMRDWVFPYIGDTKLSNISNLTLVEWSRRINAKRKEDGSDYSKATRAKVWRTLRSCLQAAPYIIGEEIPYGHFRYTPSGSQDKTKQWLNREQLSRFVETVNNYHLTKPRAMLLLIWSTGMRLGEATALNWDDIGDDSVRISKSVSDGNLNPTKTGKVRTVPLLPHVRKALEDYRAEYGKDGESRVFFSQTGEYVNRAYLFPHLNTICEKAGVPRVSPHDGRRTVNNLVRQSAGILVAQAMMGHMTDAMTEHYSEVSIEEASTAIRKALPPAPKGRRSR